MEIFNRKFCKYKYKYYTFFIDIFYYSGYDKNIKKSRYNKNIKYDKNIKKCLKVVDV